jgi:hypothetical protein
VSRRKQKTAFPPNFVHSMDSTHMMMTCLKMKEHGLHFAAVHDSYWTHPGDIPIMSKVSLLLVFCLLERLLKLVVRYGRQLPPNKSSLHPLSCSSCARHSWSYTPDRCWRTFGTRLW